MSFEYCYAYEDRAYIHTSRWCLSGVSTLATGNIAGGRLWMTASLDGDTVAASLFKSAGAEAGNLVATGTADISQIDSEAARCDILQANSSGLSGEFYFEEYSYDPDVTELLISLCDDADLALVHADLASLPVYDSALGMAAYCAAATRRVLLAAAQMYAGELGGSGAPEHRHRTQASRLCPDFRRLTNPDQLRDAAVHWALAMAMGACHECGAETMYSQLRDYHDRLRTESIDAWNLAFNTDPDTDEDADTRKTPSMVSVTRL